MKHWAFPPAGPARDLPLPARPGTFPYRPGPGPPPQPELRRDPSARLRPTPLCQVMLVFLFPQLPPPPQGPPPGKGSRPPH